MVLDRAHITPIVEGVIEILKRPAGALGLEVRKTKCLRVVRQICVVNLARPRQNSQILAGRWWCRWRRRGGVRLFRVFVRRF